MTFAEDRMWIGIAENESASDGSIGIHAVSFWLGVEKAAAVLDCCGGLIFASILCTELD